MRLAYKNRRIWQRLALRPELPDWQILLKQIQDSVIVKPGLFHERIVEKGKREGRLLMYQSIFLAKQKHAEKEEEEVSKVPSFFTYILAFLIFLNQCFFLVLPFFCFVMYCVCVFLNCAINSVLVCFG